MKDVRGRWEMNDVNCAVGDVWCVVQDGSVRWCGGVVVVKQVAVCGDGGDGDGVCVVRVHNQHSQLPTWSGLSGGHVLAGVSWK